MHLAPGRAGRRGRRLETDDPSVLLIRRVEFDHALVRAAQAAGAQLESGFDIAQVDVTDDEVVLQARDGRRLSASAVVAADGVHSVIAKRLGVNARWPRSSIAIDMMEETPNATLRADRPDVLWGMRMRGSTGNVRVSKTSRQRRHQCLLSHYDAHVERIIVSAGVRGLARRARRVARPSDRGHFTPLLIMGGASRAHHGACVRWRPAGSYAVTAERHHYAMVSVSWPLALISTRPLPKQASPGNLR